MAPSELAEIRALLIAQSETPDERRPAGLLGIVGSLLKPRGEAPAPPRPLSLSSVPPPVRAPAPPPFPQEAEPTLLLGDEIDPELFAPLDLPPPPRTEFGVRSPRPYLPHDSVLLLNKRAPAQPRRLTLLTETGEAVGEVFLAPAETAAPAKSYRTDPAEEHQAPYFPGDLEETDAPRRAARMIPREKACADRVCPPKTVQARAEAPGRGLGRDLLAALAITLAREHEALCDRLMGAAADRATR